MYYWRFRRSLLTPGFDRKVSTHQRLCTTVRGLFSFSNLWNLPDYLPNINWAAFVYAEMGGIVNSSSLFQVNPGIYIWWLYFLAGQQCRHYRLYPSSFACSGYRNAGANRAKTKAYFQASIDAQVRDQHRYAAGYRRRVYG